MNTTCQWAFNHSSPFLLQPVAMFKDDGSFTDEHRKAMGKRIEQSIKMAGLSKAEVARQMGVERAAVTYFCQKGSIALDSLAKLCLIIKAQMDFIVYGVDRDAEESALLVIQDLLQQRHRVPRPVASAKQARRQAKH